MRIGQRLYLTVMPAILGVFLLAGLAYWGEYTRRAPGIVIVAGTVAVTTSLVLTWANARYVARRIERLAAGAAVPRAPQTARAIDEIDEIERAMGRLSSAAESAEASQADRERAFGQRVQDHARLLASLVDSTARRLEEIRLPLHILLDNHFGDLNENQEEMLGAARIAAEAADADMVSLRQIAELDLGTRRLRDDRIKPSDLVEAMRPMLLASAETAGAELEIDAVPLLPAVTGDRAWLQDALVTLLRGAIESGRPEGRLRVQVELVGRRIRFILSGAGEAPPSVRWAAAARVVQAHGGKVNRRTDGVEIMLDVARSEAGVWQRGTVA